MIAVLAALAFVVPLRAGQVVGGRVRPLSLGLEPAQAPSTGRWLLPVAAVRRVTLVDLLRADADGTMADAKAAGWAAVGELLGPLPVVSSVRPGSPAATAGFAPGDVLVAVDGRPATIGAIDRALSTGTPVMVRFLRGTRVAAMALVPVPPWPQPPGGGLVTEPGVLPATPPPVDTGRVEGTSGGLVLALAYLDWLTPGDLTGGRWVAATGAIGAHGAVLPVGAYPEKVSAARTAGADLLFTPGLDAEVARAAAGPDFAVVGVGWLASAVAVLCATGGSSSVCPAAR